MKESAGLLLYSLAGGELRVVLVHPSGPYNRRAPWSLPKGEPEVGEALEDAARRETREEVGVVVTGALVGLGSVEYTRSRKRVHAWAAELPAGAEPRCASWEVDKAELLSLDEARSKLHEAQRPFLDRLLVALGRSV